MGKKSIARSLGISRNTVRDVIKCGGVVRLEPRSDTITVAPEILAKLFKECSGWKERIWEKLKDEHGIDVGYSTLTRKIRELGLGEKPRAAHVGDEPGDEMQSDTSPYRLKIGGVSMVVIGCSLYYRYSKVTYLVFYRSFDRFAMKCFFHEALMHFGHAARDCIIDNTNLAVLRGTGKAAIICPEMAQFARRYAFRFVAHEKRHPDRKAGEERSFWTVETNFIPGREFSSIEDLNRQAFVWATETRVNKPRAKSKLIPAQAFEYEKAFLGKIPEDLPAPYRVHDRDIDQYGWVAFAANFYWIPGSASGPVKVLEYARNIKIFQGRRELVAYPLPPAGTKNKIFPEDRPHIPYQPRHRERPSEGEEAELRAHSQAVSDYLDFTLKSLGVLKHRYLRELHGLRRRLSPNLFDRVIERAHRYRVQDVKTLDEIARLLVRDDADFLPESSYDETYENRAEYLEGRRTDSVDWTHYEQLMGGDDE